MSKPPLSQAETWNTTSGDTWAANAERLDGLMRAASDALFAATTFSPGQHVLDIGCGAGQTTLAIAERTGRATGADISAPLLDLARKRAAAAKSSAQFVLADAGADPLPGAPFDALFSRFGVMFFEKPEPAMAHLRAAAAPGAPMTFICWRPMNENPLMTQGLAAAQPFLKAPPAPPPPNAPGPFAFADPAYLRPILDGAGWRDVSIEPWNGTIDLGGDAESAARLLVQVGPVSRLIAEQQLDPAPITEALAARLQGAGLRPPAACWIVTAKA